MTTLFVWDENQFGLKVHEMDEEHKKLVALMNKLADRSAAGATKAEVVKLLDSLFTFTQRHFEHEEAYMRSIQFPKLAPHQAIHRQLLDALAVHAAELKAGDGRVSRKLLDFLKLWLSAHIRGIDRQYADHVHLEKSA